MSYSFSVKAANKGEATVKVAEEMERVVAGQEVHKADQLAVVRTAEYMVDAVGSDSDDTLVMISCSGYLGWKGTYPTDHSICTASVSVTVSRIPKEG